MKETDDSRDRQVWRGKISGKTSESCKNEKYTLNLNYDDDDLLLQKLFSDLAVTFITSIINFFIVFI